MVMKKISVDQFELAEGAKIEGFLVWKGTATLPDMNDPTKESLVPKVVLADATGAQKSVLLGKAAIDDLERLTIGALTLIEKGKSKKSKVSKFSFCPYVISQDLDKLLPVGK